MAEEKVKKFGKYRVERELGRGAMGVVYKGVDDATSQAYAIKVLPPNFANRDTVERFKRESFAMGKLDHPNLVHAIEHGTSEGVHYYVMEILSGQAVDKLIKQQGKIPEAKTLELLVPVLEGLNFAHLQGIVHRDIKPANVVVTKQGVVKITDFGLVQMSGGTQLTAAGSVVGTPEYMSPEQADGGEVTPQADIYALGVMCYEMLAGRVPFKGESPHAVLMKQKFEAPESLRSLDPKISEGMEQMVFRAMAKAREARYPDCATFLADAKKLAERKPEAGVAGPAKAARPSSANLDLQGTVSQAFSRRILVLSGAGVAIMIFLVLVWYVRARQSVDKMNVSEEQIRLLEIRSRVDAMQAWGGGGSSAWVLSLAEMTDEERKLVNILQERYALIKRAHRAFLVGKAHFEGGRFQPAALGFKQAVELRPDFPLYHRLLALCYEKLGYLDLAMKNWEASLTLDEESPDAQRAKRHLVRLQVEWSGKP